MTTQLQVLLTMSPASYAEIRRGLGQGSGQESLTFQQLKVLPKSIWRAFKMAYLDRVNLTSIDLYARGSDDCDAYLIAEKLVEFDAHLADSRHAHLQLVDRTLGRAATSLQGKPVELLQANVYERLFPELWCARYTARESRTTEG